MRWDGEAVAGLEEDVDEASEVLFWKRLFTSNLGAFGVDDGPDVDGAVDDEEAADVDSAVDDDANVAADGRTSRTRSSAHESSRWRSSVLTRETLSHLT